VTETKAKARIKFLRMEINRHDALYYVNAQPEISDRAYDALYEELQQLEAQHPQLLTADSPTQRVGGSPADGFRRVNHILPMLSLGKTFHSRQPDRTTVPDWFGRSVQQDENTLPQLLAFDADIRRRLGRDTVAYVMEPKVDGVSIGVHYRHGTLTLGVTRGDGQSGDDITANLRTVRAIPQQLAMPNPPALIEFRGEAYMSTDDFAELRRQQVAAGEKPFDNARNATAGTLKQLDSRIVAQRPIRAVFYAVGVCEGIEFETHERVLESLSRFGLPTQRRWWCRQGMDEVIDVYRNEVVCHYDNKRDLRCEVPYQIDGIVIKVNNRGDAQRIPSKTREPGDAIVHKPITWIATAETVLRDITIQVGRTGVLTPVAELVSVELEGSTISRATLHNEDEIHRKDIRVGDTVVIRKAGMVIPEVVEVVESKRSPLSKTFDFGAHIGDKCPVCHGPIEKERVSAGDKDEVAWRCKNVAGCPAQQTRRIEYFSQRKALDIESLGSIVAEKLVERGVVKEPLDLFDLTKERLAKLNLGTGDEKRVFGEKNAARVIEALDRARMLPLHRWIHALAIPDVGEQTAFDLASFFADLSTLAESSLLRDTAELGRLRQKFENNSVKKGETLSKAEKLARKREQEEAKRLGNPIGRRLIQAGFARPSGEDKQARTQDWQARTLVGPASAKAIVDWADSDHGRRALRRMKELKLAPQGQSMAPVSKGANRRNVLSDKTFVLTGTLSTLSRDEASSLIREAGGKVTDSVTKHIDYVLAGEDPGAKLDKARALKVTVISESDFLEMIDASEQLKNIRTVRSEIVPNPEIKRPLAGGSSLSNEARRIKGASKRRTKGAHSAEQPELGL
jgi:DNA ligase (NAD+)